MGARLYTRVVTRCIDCLHIEHTPAHKERGVTWSCIFSKGYEIGDPYRAIPRKCPLPQWDEPEEVEAQ